MGRTGARAIGGFIEKPSDAALQQQQRLTSQINRMVGGTGVKLPYSTPRNMREFLINQQYLASVDPVMDTETLRGQQSQRALDQVVRRFARSNRAVGGGQPVQFRSPRRATPVAAPWDRMYATAVWQDEPDLQSYLLSVKYDGLRRNMRPLD